MLFLFLDVFGISHDGDGDDEDVPDALDPKKVKSTIEKLLKDHDSEVVKIYLSVFQLQRSNGWDAISDVIAATPALQFGAEETAAEEKTEEPATDEEE